MENIVNTTTQLAHSLRQRRKAQGKTQDELGAAAGLLQKTISALETTPEGSEIGTLLKLISALNLEVVLRPKPDAESESW